MYSFPSNIWVHELHLKEKAWLARREGGRKRWTAAYGARISFSKKSVGQWTATYAARISFSEKIVVSNIHQELGTRLSQY